MSTPYNDQWVLPRPGQEPHPRDSSHEPQRTHTLRERARAAREGVGSVFHRPRKRPRWIDRDT